MPTHKSSYSQHVYKRSPSLLFMAHARDCISHLIFEKSVAGEVHPKKTSAWEYRSPQGQPSPVAPESQPGVPAGPVAPAGSVAPVKVKETVQAPNGDDLKPVRL